MCLNCWWSLSVFYRSVIDKRIIISTSISWTLCKQVLRRYFEIVSDTTFMNRSFCLCLAAGRHRCCTRFSGFVSPVQSLAGRLLVFMFTVQRLYLGSCTSTNFSEQLTELYSFVEKVKMRIYRMRLYKCETLMWCLVLWNDLYFLMSDSYVESKCLGPELL